ncbi:hypothetical protein GJ744_012046 [Endocarpon pusillum]|uniref:Uncharacterized protein n=1 Tax=Endocarpon pusillum TaxID=364733 RepID=A0A8H7APN6_9EURO|nr:hypothetical protein GJ744_012046 [Endocarpon pusillum]
MDQVKYELDQLSPVSAPGALRYRYVNAWKPWLGPVRDWPLTVCDANTVDSKKDLQPRDLVGLDRISETYQVHYSPTQTWFYMSNQMPNEVWLFLQADSSGQTGIPHTAFPHPDVGEDDLLRESIEVRMIVYHDLL